MVSPLRKGKGQETKRLCKMPFCFLAIFADVIRKSSYACSFQSSRCHSNWFYRRTGIQPRSDRNRKRSRCSRVFLVRMLPWVRLYERCEQIFSQLGPKLEHLCAFVKQWKNFKRKLLSIDIAEYLTTIV